MSRRKQGKPQQRRKIDSFEAEAETDTLTCGACQSVFPLTDIVKFIQHKVNRCNKENEDPYEGTNGFDDEEQSEHLTVRNARRPSISAPIACHRSPEGREKLLSSSPRPSIDISDLPLGDETNCKRFEVKPEESNDEADVRLQEKSNRRQIEGRSKGVDVGVNTDVTEPCKFLCCSCKSQFLSAWSLVHHAQRNHNIKIYIEPNHNEYPESEKKEIPRLLPTVPKSIRPEKEGKPPSRSPTPKRSASPMKRQTLHEAFVPPHAPFMFPMPERPPVSPNVGGPTCLPAPFPRPPDFPIIADPFQRMPVGMGMHRPPFEHPGLPPSYPSHPYPFDRIDRIERHVTERIERHAPKPPPTTSAEDFYSQRLRQLANHGPPSSPSDAPSPGQKIGSRDGQGQSNLPAFSPSTSQPPPPPSSSASSESLPARTPQVLEAKDSACEYCGKCFKYQSNLIVHRRSHTGDKPFGCSMCPHSSNQASKLKKHMKIHSKTSSLLSATANAENGTSSPSHNVETKQEVNSEGSNHGNEESGEMDKRVEADEEAAAMEEEEALAELAMAQEEAETSGQPFEFPDSEEEEEEVSSTMEIKEEDNSDDLGEDGSPDDSLAGEEQERKSSLLSEVMENSGLLDITEYSKAFKQALAENKRGDQESHDGDNKSKKSDISENGIKDDPSPGTDGSSSQLYDQSSETPPPAKKLKREPELDFNRDHTFPRPDMFSNHPVWFPPAGMPPEFFMLRHPDRIMHRAPLPPSNASGVLNHHECAFRDTRKTGTNHSQLNATPTAPTPPVPVNRRRNDTCEFCGKVFKNCSNLTVHRRSHTGEKPYKCQLCSYACAQSSKLTRHMKTHGRLGKDVYRCKFCAMPFSVPSTLEKHMRKCVESQQGRAMLDHEGGLSPAGLSPVGLGGPSPAGAFTPPSSGIPSPTSGGLPHPRAGALSPHPTAGTLPSPSGGALPSSNS